MYNITVQPWLFEITTRSQGGVYISMAIRVMCETPCLLRRSIIHHVYWDAASFLWIPVLSQRNFTWGFQQDARIVLRFSPRPTKYKLNEKKHDVTYFDITNWRSFPHCAQKIKANKIESSNLRGNERSCNCSSNRPFLVLWAKSIWSRDTINDHLLLIEQVMTINMILGRSPVPGAPLYCSEKKTTKQYLCSHRRKL